jgi:hypothetical protein
MQISDCSIRIQSTNHRCWLRRVETRIFPFSWIFPCFFQKALVGIKLFYFFTIFYIFLWTRIKKRCNQKNWHLQLRWDVVYRNTARSVKSVQKLWQFFLYFPEFFLAILMKPNTAKPKWWNNLLLSVGHSCKMNLCRQENMWSYG